MVKKRGISPLIATVLIIGFTIALAAIIITWGSSFSQKLMKTSEKSAYKNVVCSTDIAFTVKNSCLSENEITGNEISFLVSNDAGGTIDSFLITLNGDLGSERKNIDANLAPYDIKKLDMKYDVDKLGVLKQVELIPFTTLDNELVLCSNNVYNTEDLNTCTLSELQVEACASADQADTCDTKLKQLGIVKKEDCCLILGLCC